MEVEEPPSAPTSSKNRGMLFLGKAIEHRAIVLMALIHNIRNATDGGVLVVVKRKPAYTRQEAVNGERGRGGGGG